MTFHHTLTLVCFLGLQFCVCVCERDILIYSINIDEKLCIINTCMYSMHTYAQGTLKGSWEKVMRIFLLLCKNYEIHVPFFIIYLSHTVVEDPLCVCAHVYICACVF